MPAEIVLAGHGEPITDHAELIDARFDSTERRKEKIYNLIAERRAAATSWPRRFGATSR